jgi:cell division septum initiation protein DivIVA
MTDKEFKRLSRSQLIDIIYQLQLKQNELEAENERLTKALDDKRLRVSKAGNIAEAALEVHNVMQAAQNAAALYLEEIRIMRDETAKKCQFLLEIAQKEADAMIGQAASGKPYYGSAVEAIMKEFGRDNAAAGDGT